MRYAICLALALLASCSIVDNTADTKINRLVPAMVYLVPSPYMAQYDQVVIISAPTKDIGIVHVDKDERHKHRLRYREVRNATVHFSQGRVFLSEIRDTIIAYNEVNERLKEFRLEGISYPHVWLDGRRYSYETFIMDYRSVPRYSVGDMVWAVTKMNQMEAIR